MSQLQTTTQAARRSYGALGWLLRLAGRGLPPGNVLLCTPDEVLGVDSGIEALEQLAEADAVDVVYVRGELPDMSVGALLRQCEVLRPLVLRATLIEVASEGYDNCVTLDESPTPALLEDLRRLALLTESMRTLHAQTHTELLERVDAEADLRAERRRLVRYLRAVHFQAPAERGRYLETVLEYLGLHDDVQLRPQPLRCALYPAVNAASAAVGVEIDNLVGRGIQVDVDIDLFEGALRGALAGLRELADEYGLNAMPIVRVYWRSGLVMELPELVVPLSRLDTLSRPFRLREDGGPAGMHLAHAFYLAGCAEVGLDLQPGPRARGIRVFWALADAAAV